MTAAAGRLAAVVLAALVGSSPTPASVTGARFAGDGALLYPDGFHEWVFAGASLGLSYTVPSSDDGHGLFHNVYIHPEAYAHFRKTGAFPEGTMLVLELFRAGTKSDPARGGLFESESVAVEAAVKDAARFDGGWGYFGFGSGRASARVFPRESCFECHKAHAATDNVFTQFYPTLRAPR